MPQCSVVICSRTKSSDGGGKDVPEGMKTAFRKWDEVIVGECKVLALTQALEGLGEGR